MSEEKRLDAVALLARIATDLERKLEPMQTAFRPQLTPAYRRIRDEVAAEQG